MRMTLSFAVATGAMMLTIGAAGGAQTPAPASVPTFTRDVAPILYAHCVECHRGGEIAPMPLGTYAEARPWARAIARQVRAGTMPPWHADSPAGTFRNERVLTPEQKDLIERWAAAGAPQGDAADQPPAPVFATRLAHRPARRRLRNAGGLRRAVERGARVRELLRSNGVHRRTLGASHRGPARQPRSRAPHPRVLRSRSGRTRRGGDPGPQSRGRREAAEGTRQEAFARVEGSEPPAGHLRARHESPGVSPRNARCDCPRAASCGFKCTTRPTARPAQTARGWA